MPTRVNTCEKVTLQFVVIMCIIYFLACTGISDQRLNLTRRAKASFWRPWLLRVWKKLPRALDALARLENKQWFHKIQHFARLFPSFSDHWKPRDGGCSNYYQRICLQLALCEPSIFFKKLTRIRFPRIPDKSYSALPPAESGQVVSKPFYRFICYFPVTRYFSLTRKSFRIFSLWAVFPTHHKWIHALNWQTILQAHNRCCTFTYHS